MVDTPRRIVWDCISFNRHNELLDHYANSFNPAYCQAFSEQVMNLINDGYLRTRFIGFEQDTEEEQRLYVSNHSGMAFPWDGLVFTSQLFRLRNYNSNNKLRILTAPALSNIRLMSPFQLQDLWRRCGGVDASYNNFEALFYQPDDILIYPEGVAGIGKGFNNKYSLQRFATSFIRLALQYDKKIVPIYTINGEYINPHVYSISWINNLTQKIGIPFIPMGLITIFIFFQPWMFYMAFPARFTYVRGEEIDLSALPEYEIEDPETRIKALRKKVKQLMQANLTDAVKEYGQRPYDIKHLFTSIKKDWKLFPLLMPFGWVFLFSEFERRWDKEKDKDLQIQLGFWSWIIFLFRNPFSIFYFIPILGWIPIAIKGYQATKQEK